MRLTGQTEKWAVGVLGAVSLVLVAHLVLQYKRGRVGDRRAGARTPAVAKVSVRSGAKGAAARQRTPDDLSRYDSVVKLDLLKELEDRPLPELTRNPFEFMARPIQASRIATTAAAAGPAPPPPPPPMNLKVMGYTEGKEAANEAMVELCAASCEISSPDDEVLVVHAGDSVGTRYKIIKITSTIVTVEDATLHQTVDLPVPQ